MQMLWIGCLESNEEFMSKAKKGYDLASAQVSQQNLVKGIEQITGQVFDTINGSVLPPYPVYEDRIIEPVAWSHVPGAADISVGYKNDKYINRVNCKKAMIKAAENWVSTQYSGEELIVFVYSMRSAPMATACFIKKKIPCAKIYLIVTDLPQFMDLGQNKIKAVLKKIDWFSIKRMQREFDGFVLYASKMAEYLNISKDKWILMEGSFDCKEEVETTIFEKKKAIMYSGKLDRQYGIPMLVDAFMTIKNEDIELWITGGGNAEEYVQECANKDKRIKYFGFLPSREDVLQLQRKASLLINMRLPSEEASNYCFPSKLFEYMATGVPVLSFNLGGIPEEYAPYLCLIDEETKERVAFEIEKWINTTVDELNQKGAEAKRFICDNKNLQAQCRLICRFVFNRN